MRQTSSIRVSPEFSDILKKKREETGLSIPDLTMILSKNISGEAGFAVFKKKLSKRKELVKIGGERDFLAFKF